MVFFLRPEKGGRTFWEGKIGKFGQGSHICIYVYISINVYILMYAFSRAATEHPRKQGLLPEMSGFLTTASTQMAHVRAGLRGSSSLTLHGKGILHCLAEDS